jgi:hypothetical protein
VNKWVCSPIVISLVGGILGAEQHKEGLEMAKMRVYQAIARALQARATCIQSGKEEMAEMWEERLRKLTDYLPHGSGFDRGESIDIETSEPEKIIINGEYHVMNESGWYDGHAIYRIIITPSLVNEFDLKLIGSSSWPGRRAYEGLKDYVLEVYHEALENEITWQDLDN